VAAVSQEVEALTAAWGRLEVATEHMVGLAEQFVGALQARRIAVMPRTLRKHPCL